MPHARSGWIAILLVGVHCAVADEPSPPPTPPAPQTLTPQPQTTDVPPCPTITSPPAETTVPAPCPTTPSYPLTDTPCYTGICRAVRPLDTDQLAGMKRALQILEDTNHYEAAIELRRAVTELELEYALQQLDEKTATIASLRAEIENLRTTDSSQQVVLTFRILEFSKTKFQNMGFECGLEQLLALPASDSNLGYYPADSAKTLPLLENLCANNIARVLAEPTLVTVSGRKASFQSGGEVPVPGASLSEWKYAPIGTLLEVLPTLESDGTLRIEMHVQISEIDKSLDVKLADRTVPGFRKRQVKAVVVVKPGNSLLLRGPTQRRTETMIGKDNEPIEYLSETEMLVIIRPELQRTPAN